MKKESYKQPFYGQSRIPDVVGIIVIFLSSWYLLVSFFELIGVSYGLNKDYLIELKYNANNAYDFSSLTTNLINIIGLAGAVWLLIIGKGLIKYKNWARLQLNYYVIFSQLNALLMFIIGMNDLPASLSNSTFSTVHFLFAGIYFIDPLVYLFLALLLNQPFSKNSLY